LKRKFSLIILIVFLAGCASQAVIKPESEFKIKGNRTVSVVVKTLLPECAQEITEIQKRLIEKLRNEGIFSSVTEQSHVADLLIKIDIAELAKVSKSDRFWYGSMAGRAKIAGRVTLAEGSGNKTLGSFYVESLSSGGSIFAGTTDEAIDKFVNEVVRYLLENTVN